MKKKFRKGTDVEFMGNPIEEWIRNNLSKFEDEKGELNCNIEIHIIKHLENKKIKEGKQEVGE